MKSLLLLAILAIPADASPRWLHSKMLRRVVTAGACAASFADLGATRHAIAAGAVERNPLLMSGGRFAAGRTSGIKAGVCATTILLGELSPRSTPAATAIAGVQLGVFSWAAAHNVRVAGGIR